MKFKVAVATDSVHDLVLGLTKGVEAREVLRRGMLTWEYFCYSSN